MRFSENFSRLPLGGFDHPDLFLVADDYASGNVGWKASNITFSRDASLCPQMTINLTGLPSAGKPYSSGKVEIANFGYGEAAAYVKPVFAPGVVTEFAFYRDGVSAGFHFLGKDTTKVQLTNGSNILLWDLEFDASQKWNLYSINWTADKVQWKIGRRTIWEIASNTPLQSPARLVMDLWTGDTAWLGDFVFTQNLASHFKHLDYADEQAIPAPQIRTGGSEENYQVEFSNGGDAVPIFPQGTIESVEAISKIEVTIENLPDGDSEMLELVASGDITATYSNGILVVSGHDSAANYQQVLRTAKYRNNSTNPSTVARSIKFSVSTSTPDIAVGRTVVTIAVPNVAPILMPVSYETTFVKGGEAVAAFSSTGTLTDAGTISSATVTIVNLLDGSNEVLSASVVGNISADYNNGILSFSGEDTPANYQEVLRSITYNNLASAPNVITRVIYFVVSDGSLMSNASASSVAIAVPSVAPTISPEQFEATFVRKGGAVYIFGSYKFRLSGDGLLSGATVAIANLINGDDEVLSAFAAGNIAVSYSNGVLVLTGQEEVANYQEVLQSVTYNNLATIPGTATREITVTVSDGELHGYASGALQVQIPSIDLGSDIASGFRSRPPSNTVNNTYPEQIYSFTTIDTVKISATMTVTGGNADMALFDSAGSMLAASNKTGTQTESIVLMNSSPDTYFIRAYQVSSGSVASIRLSINFD